MKLSALNYHRFSYNFIDYKNCSLCDAPVEDLEHFLFYCPIFLTQRQHMLTGITNIIAPGCHWSLLLDLSKEHLKSIILYGSPDLHSENNVAVFKIVQEYLLSSGRFSSTGWVVCKAYVGKLSSEVIVGIHFLLFCFTICYVFRQLDKSSFVKCLT